MKRHRIAIKIDPEILEKIKQHAKFNHRSVSGEIGYRIEQHYKDEPVPVPFVQDEP